MADDVVRIKTGVSMRSIHNSTREDVVEIPRSEWDAMTSEERQALLDDIADTTFSNEVDAWAVVDEKA